MYRRAYRGPVPTRSALTPVPPRLPSVVPLLEETDLGPDVHWERVEVRGDYMGESSEYVDISESRLVGVRLTGVDLGQVTARDTVFDGCDLSATALGEATLTRVVFHECRMGGVILSRSKLRDVTFSDCMLDDANFRMVTGERTLFDQSSLRAADFYGASLAVARFAGCDLRGAQFSKSNVKGARFHGSNVDAIKGADALKGVAIDPAQVVPLGLSVFAALGIRVEDDVEDDEERG